jgi:hypothetical protein
MAFTGNFTCNVFKTGLLDGAVDFGSGVFKIALYTNNATLNQNTTSYTTDGEVVAVGYVAGGEVLTPTVSGSDGVSFVSFGNAVWNGAFTARGALIYKVGGPAICVLDFGADRTSVNQFQVQFPPATADSAILRLS